MTAPRHGTRTKARKRALDILFEAELRGRDALDTLADHIVAGHPPVREFTSDLVKGVHEHREAIDARIAASLSAAWTLDRMPRVDRNLARIAVYEIDYTDVAPEVAIGEAVALSAELSTDESPGFLNGMLAVVLTGTAKGR
ncbi:MAG: transcription antitermination factor NusB [Propionibacteriaceae bacterium]|nr:transcription antitermination factor NusB [Propionibacteriaceae bacterium]